MNGFIGGSTVFENWEVVKIPEKENLAIVLGVPASRLLSSLSSSPSPSSSSASSSASPLFSPSPSSSPSSWTGVGRGCETEVGRETVGSEEEVVVVCEVSEEKEEDGVAADDRGLVP